jgi:preprotein translocase subunit YajC
MTSPTLISFLAEAQQGSPLGMLPPMLLMLVIFYFVGIRPQRIAAKQLAEKISALKKGDEVILQGGLHAKISTVQEKYLIVILGEAGKVKVEKSAVSTIVSASSSSSSDTGLEKTVEAEVVEEKK